MIVAIHQPHYFPWLGYLNKMAYSDAFVVLDQVQLEKGSQMYRNRVLDNNGSIKYLTISYNTDNYLNRHYREIETKENAIWKKNQLSILKNYYRKAKYYSEMIEMIEDFLNNNSSTLFSWTFESILFLKKIFEINTPLLLQSEIDYDKSRKRSDLVLSICDAMHADVYLSGRGASIEYLNQKDFNEHGIEVKFQEFVHPVYQQCSTSVFVPGLSSLDCLFNCGIKEARALFWNQLEK